MDDSTLILPRLDPANDTADEALIELRGAAMTYPGPPPVEALRPVNLRVASGEYLAIVGPSGSGKSTLLNLLGLLDEPTAGTYYLDGRDTSALKDSVRTRLRAEKIGFVFQAFHLMAHRTTTENVAMPLIYQGVRRPRRKALARAKLELVGLDHRLDALPSTLSGGERQRVAIARALAAEPSLLLCDEPTGNLDSVTAEQILDLINSLHDRGLTVVVITHDEGVAARAERVITIRDGSIADDRPNGMLVSNAFQASILLDWILVDAT